MKYVDEITDELQRIMRDYQEQNHYDVRIEAVECMPPVYNDEREAEDAYLFLKHLIGENAVPVEFMESDFSRLVLTPYWIPVCAVAFVAVILFVFGFTAACSKIYTSSGPLGLVGYILLTTAYIFQAGQLVLEIFFYPAIASTEGGLAIFRQEILIAHPMAQAFSILFMVFIGLGVVLFGITVLRSKVYSKVSGILFMVGAVLYAAWPVFLMNLAGIIMFAAGCFLIGLRVQSNSSPC